MCIRDRSKEACDENLAAAGWGRADRDAFLALGYGGYWLSFDPETHVRHAQMVRDAEARGAPLLVETSRCRRARSPRSRSTSPTTRGS